MTEAQEDIRSSVLTTLSFLASEAQQQEFASKVYYACYQDEFACWWYDDTCYDPDEPGVLEMFTAEQLAALRVFSTTFDLCSEALGSGLMTIQQLQAKVEWQSIVLKAKETLLKFENAI